MISAWFTHGVVRGKLLYNLYLSVKRRVISEDDHICRSFIRSNLLDLCVNIMIKLLWHKFIFKSDLNSKEKSIVFVSFIFNFVLKASAFLTTELFAFPLLILFWRRKKTYFEPYEARCRFRSRCNMSETTQNLIDTHTQPFVDYMAGWSCWRYKHSWQNIGITIF